MKVLLGGVLHHVLIETARLVVFRILAFVVEVRLARDNVVAHFVGCLGRVRSELVHKAVGCVLRVLPMICVGPQGTVEVEGVKTQP